MIQSPWRLAAIGAAATFFALSLSNEVYALASPVALSWHVALRKLESIIAFAIVGYTRRRAIREAGRTPALAVNIIAVAAYSAAIEVAQAIHGSHEGLGWNAIDTLCGAAGGALGWLGSRRGRDLGEQLDDRGMGAQKIR